MTAYTTDVSCTVCFAKPGDPCVMHTDEFPEMPMGTPMDEPHYFGGRRILEQWER